MNIHHWTGADRRFRVFASPASWIEGASVAQLRLLAGRRGFLSAAAMADLHPGHKGPVGCAIETEGVIHPDLVGTDIGCGMALFALDIEQRQLHLDKAFKALHGLHEAVDAGDRAHQAAIAPDHAPGMGTVGGGNHFLELQVLDDRADEAACAAHGLRRGALFLLVHTGSRSLGPEVLERHGVGERGLDLQSPEGIAYLADHDRAVAFAAANRKLLAETAASLVRGNARLITDQPHNFVEPRPGGRVLHRKGAAPADRGLSPLPGSRGAQSHLLLPEAGPGEALASLPHGAGRKRDRAGMSDRAKDGDRPPRANPLGNRIICADRRMAAEEAPDAYKNIARVLADVEEAGLARSIARFRPIVTFKTAEARGR